jgi:hypothetical protein
MTATPCAFEIRKSPACKDHPAETRGSSGSAKVVVCSAMVVVVGGGVVAVVSVEVVGVERTVVVDEVSLVHAPATTTRATNHTRRDCTRRSYPP